MPGCFTGLRGVRLIDDDRKSFPGQVPHLLGDHREFLEGGDDDVFPVLQCFSQLLRIFSDGFNSAQGLFKLADC